MFTMIQDRVLGLIFSDGGEPPLLTGDSVTSVFSQAPHQDGHMGVCRFIIIALVVFIGIGVFHAGAGLEVPFRPSMPLTFSNPMMDAKSIDVSDGEIGSDVAVPAYKRIVGRLVQRFWWPTYPSIDIGSRIIRKENTNQTHYIWLWVGQCWGQILINLLNDNFRKNSARWCLATIGQMYMSTNWGFRVQGCRLDSNSRYYPSSLVSYKALVHFAPLQVEDPTGNSCSCRNDCSKPNHPPIRISKPTQGKLLLLLIFAVNFGAVWLIGIAAPTAFEIYGAGRGWLCLSVGMLLLICSTATIGHALHLIAGF